MTFELIVRTTLIAVAIVLIAIGVWHNDKMVALEDWLLDRAAYFTAMAIVSYRTAKHNFLVWMIHIHYKLLRYLLESDEKYIKKTGRNGTKKAACSFRPKILQATHATTIKRSNKVYHGRKYLSNKE